MQCGGCGLYQNVYFTDIRCFHGVTSVLSALRVLGGSYLSDWDDKSNIHSFDIKVFFILALFPYRKVDITFSEISVTLM